MLAGLILLASVNGYGEEEPQPQELYSRAAVLLDGNSKRVLYGKNETEKLPMASTTKIMTCILALEHGDLSQECEVSSLAAAAPKVKLGAPAGRRFLLEDLLYSLMLESHNDSAVVIAEAIGGSVEGFAVLMNRKAEELGLADTSFVTPNGLDADGHYTTAADLAKLMSYCVAESPKKEEFLTITQRQSYTFSDTGQNGSYSVVNHNAFLNMMDGVISGKTGFTGNAGYCYVCALEREGRLFVVALLACGWPGNRTWKWFDTRLLLKYGIDNYRYYEEQVDSVNLPQTLSVEQGAYDWSSGETESRVKIESGHSLRISTLRREDEKLRVRVKLPEKLEAPVSKGETIGIIEYWLEDFCVRTDPVIVAESAAKTDQRWYFREVLEQFFMK
ncbi:MAG: D-alanyl-D-alanine carboxypeptidase [Lachnospiraceae bacterium]|nr:D-alanyl-D-alanine carboxypeptidase [Lachnospiraceae bacterium]